MATQLRQAEIIMALSLATDLGTGRPMEWALCSALLSIRLGETLGLGIEELRHIYYVALLRHIGCTADMNVSLELFGDDPGAAGQAYDFVDPTQTPQILGWMLRYVGAGQPFLQRIRTMSKLSKAMESNSLGHCEVAVHLAERLGFDNAVQESLWQSFERWDGRGMPYHLKDEELSLPARIVQLAQDVETYRRQGGVEAAITVVRQRAGRAYDPRLAEQFCRIAPRLIAELEQESSWELVLASEPEPQLYLSEDEIDNAAQVIADFVDFISPFYACHSRNVAALATVAARDYGLSTTEAKAVERMGWIHDFGKVAIAPGIWNKSGALSGSEWERVRLHSYYTERFLARAGVLASLGQCAALHHERLDGSGYHRGQQSIPATACILAAANFYQARIEPRPFRDAFSPEAVADELRREVRVGRLDSDAVKAVLTAAGHHSTPVRRERLAGLSERELEVLRLIARGFSNREMARHLDVSGNTVGTHIKNIYQKINVSTRAGATLFVMQHNLLTDDFPNPSAKIT